MSSAELEQLEQDIETKGLHNKITLYQGKILDGRHRYEICKKLGLKADFQEYGGDDPLGYVVSANLCRRHMSDGQRALVAARLKEKGWLSANLRSEKKSEQAAVALNVKSRTVESAVNVLKSGIPTLVQAVSEGLVSVSAGEIVAKMPVEEQARIVAKGKDSIVRAAARVRNAKKSVASAVCAGMETSRANKQQSSVKKDPCVRPCNGPDVESSGDKTKESVPEPIEENMYQLTPNEAQLINFIRQALKTGARWVIAGTGTVPKLQTDWLAHMIYSGDLSNVPAEDSDHVREKSTDDFQNAGETSGYRGPKVSTDSGPAVVPSPQKEEEDIDPILKEALKAGAKEYFRIKKIMHGDIYQARQWASDMASKLYKDKKGLDFSAKKFPIIDKWRKMGWWPQTRAHTNEVEQFFRTIEERLETGEKLKYDRSKNIQRRSSPQD